MAQETEIDFYARVGNPSGFSKATRVIKQEQAEHKTPTGSLRVRMHKADGAPEWTYELTTKIKRPPVDGVKSSQESTTAITKEAYEIFKSSCVQFMRKVRYVFAIPSVNLSSGGFSGELECPGLCYEVDRFVMPDGRMSDHVKIDLELDPLYKALALAGVEVVITPELVVSASALPFEPTGLVFEGAGAGDTKKTITQLYQNEFLRQVTPAHAPAEPPQAPTSD